MKIEPKSKKLITRAKEIVSEYKLGGNNFSAGSVSAALLTKQGNIYTGISIDVACGIGFCAEHAAIAEMLKFRETEIEVIVAVDKKSVIVPCGRCRELIYQINKNNVHAKIIMDVKGNYKTLDELLPYKWS